MIWLSTLIKIIILNTWYCFVSLLLNMWSVYYFRYILTIMLLLLFVLDVVSIPKTNENFRLLYDTKGRFRLHSIRDEESKVSCYHLHGALICYFLWQSCYIESILVWLWYCFCSLSSAKFAQCNLGRRESLIWTLTTDVQSVIPTPWSRQTTPSSWTSTQTRSLISSSSMSEMLWWWPVEEIVDESEWLKTGRSTREALRLFTFRMQLGTNLPLGCAMSSPSGRGRSHGYPFRRARVSNYPSLKRPGRGLPTQQQPRLKSLSIVVVVMIWRQFLSKFCTLFSYYYE